MFPAFNFSFRKQCVNIQEAVQDQFLSMLLRSSLFWIVMSSHHLRPEIRQLQTRKERDSFSKIPFLFMMLPIFLRQSAILETCAELDPTVLQIWSNSITSEWCLGSYNTRPKNCLCWTEPYWQLVCHLYSWCGARKSGEWQSRYQVPSACVYSSLGPLGKCCTSSTPCHCGNNLSSCGMVLVYLS